MTKAIRYIIFTLVIWAYIFGSSGFVVHKCYMSDSCFVSNSIISAWNSFTSGNCTNTQAGQASSDERENTDNVCVWAQTKGKCSESVYALNDYQFQNQSDTDIQPLVSQADLGYQNDFPDFCS